MDTKSNYKKSARESATKKLKGDLGHSIVEHFGISEKASSEKAARMIELLEFHGLIDEVIEVSASEAIKDSSTKYAKLGRMEREFHNAFMRTFGFSDEKASEQVKDMMRILEEYEFTDELVDGHPVVEGDIKRMWETAVGGKDSTTDGRFLPEELLKFSEIILEKEASDEDRGPMNVKNQRRFLRHLFHEVEEMYQESEERTGTEDVDLYRAICLLSSMAAIHEPLKKIDRNTDIPGRRLLGGLAKMDFEE